MDTNKLEQLLKEISKIVLKDKVQQEEKRKRGEKFNIFSVIGVQRKEVRLHSAFLAELLNPQGNHGLGDRFLVAFLEKTFGKNNNPLETKTAKVEVEYVIGNGEIFDDGKRGGRIDILLTDQKNNAIIIENKIDANDQKNQLLRYYNFAKDNEFNYDLIYLTKEGDRASDYSTGKEKFDYKCISYRDKIIPWLDYCEQIATRYPLIRETIHQYIINLKEILNIMENMNVNSLLEVMLEKENACIISDILDLKDKWLKALFDRYIWRLLKAYLQEKGNEFELDECDDGGRCIKNELWGNYSIVISGKATAWTNMYIGIKSDKEMNELFEKLTCFDQGPTKEWPYGWAYLPSHLGNWEDAESIVNYEVLNYLKGMIDKIIEELSNKII